MKKLVEDYLAARSVAAVEAACYGLSVQEGEDFTSEGYVKPSCLWKFAFAAMKEEKTPVEVLARTATTIRQETGWNDPVETLAIHAYIAKSQHEALVEEKRRREDAEEGISAKRQTRGDKARQEPPSPPEVPMTDVPSTSDKERKSVKEKGKGLAYKLQSDIEAATDLKAVLEERVLDAEVKFSLRQVLGIAKKEFHDIIIDIVKRKRLQKGLRVRFEDEIEEEGDVNPSHYTRDHWARATGETMVKLEDHTWRIKAVNNTTGGLIGACPEVRLKTGNVEIEQNIFVQDMASYPVILGQPFITAVRMETRVLDDGSAYARIRSKDGKQANGFAVYKKVEDLERWERKEVTKMQKQLQSLGELEDDEWISGVYEECGLENPLEEIAAIGMGKDDVVVQIESRELYSVIEEFEKVEVRVETKYKTVDKNVKPVAAPLPEDAKKQIEQASRERSLMDTTKMGHRFSDDTLDELRVGVDSSLLPEEVKCFKQMLARHGKAFAFAPSEIGCVDPSVVSPMVIFTVPHVLWDLRPIPVPRAYLPKLIDLLKEKMHMRIQEPSFAPYSSRWFTVPKKSGALRFIQDMQPVNAVTIRNVGVGPIVDEFAEAFAGKAIYSLGDLYSGYDQFQLAEGSRDVTIMRTSLGLVRMCTLPQGATNSVVHMMAGMNKVLKDFIPEKTMPFLDDVPIKGCKEDEKDEALDMKGCRKYVTEHIQDCEKILSRLEEVHLTLSGTKSTFGVREIVIVGHLCGS
ncbi:hypothetical protein R1sor_002174 [Riccia sorocarpa]|uniref:Reverse transcriptase domain-containing protein n=1 Tax=Riccia sorocarpa TaxID=122646 RepID=A0ABD3GY15_9MARC